MKKVSVLTFSLLIGLLAAAPLHAQTARTFDPRDLQGTWTNATITSFERPVELGDKEFLTEKEIKELEARAAANRVDRAPQAGDVGTYNQF